jgi:hypothetical protein
MQPDNEDPQIPLQCSGDPVISTYTAKAVSNGEPIKRHFARLYLPNISTIFFSYKKTMNSVLSAKTQRTGYCISSISVVSK